MVSHEYWLYYASQLALVYQGSCAPNPTVAAIVVQGDACLSWGVHKGAGTSHAEVQALEAVAHITKGMVLYVTLEPCCHWGHTPPCTDLILARGIKKVVFGQLDANSKVSGQGQNILQAAGVEVINMAIPEILELYAPYSNWQNTAKASLSLKLAVSLDGKIAGAWGQPLAITGEETRVWVHRQRSLTDAILTSLPTILADDPQLNVRLGGQVESKHVVVWDPRAQMPLNAKVWGRALSLTILHGEDASCQALERNGARCVFVPGLAKLCEALGSLGWHHVWVEVGQRLSQELLRRMLVARFIVALGNTSFGSGLDWPVSVNLSIRSWRAWLSGQDLIWEAILANAPSSFFRTAKKGLCLQD